jgi:hypothetical protein
MRTTLTLEEDLARELHRIARQSGRSFKEVVNSALRKGLAEGEKPLPDLAPFEVDPIASEFRAGVDAYRLNQANDELELEDFRRELATERR